MKKYLYTLLLGTLLAGCTANEPKTDGNANTADVEVKGYLSINLVTTGSPRTRDGEDPSEPTNNGKYQYGTAEENYVNEVRFFFFYDQGKPCPIRKNPNYVVPEEGNTTDNPLTDQNGQIEYFSYYDWSPTYAENQNGAQGNPGGDLSESDGPGSLGENATIEKVLTAMVVLTSKEGYAPQQVVAIINPTPSIKGMQNPTLQELEDVVANFHDGLVESNFVMSNTAQIGLDEQKEQGVIIAQDIDPNCLQATQPDAQQHPMVVYVERVVARLNQKFDFQQVEGSQLTPITINEGMPNEYVIYPTQFYFTSQDVDYTEDGTQGEDPDRESYDNTPLYVHFLGWAITSTPKFSYLIKNITAQWGGADELFGAVNEPWYLTEYHRTFWAMNPSTLTSNSAQPDYSYYWYNYNQLTGATALLPGEGEVWTMNDTKAYMQENANRHNTTGLGENPEEPTKVIYAAEICDNTGQPVTVAEWNGVYFTLTGLKELAASMLQMYYRSGGTDDNPEYKAISPDQITFITRREFLNSNTAIFSEPGSYYVYPTLTSNADAATEDQAMQNAASLQWYHHANDGSANPYTQINSASLNQYMYDTFGVSKIWNNGQTYYYFEINHLGMPDYPGYYGVVRNHIYDVTVNGLKGLGTPVWDPDEDIYPEKPNPEGNNISAQVKVLMWRMVTQDVEFDW